METKETRKNIIQAGRKAVNELIKVAEEAIVEILKRIEEEDLALQDKPKEEVKEEQSFKGFAERRSKK